MRGLIDEFGVLELVPAENEFQRLVTSIINQSVSTAAATAVRERVFDELNGDVTPERVLGTDESRLVEAGLGKAKTEYVKNAAEAFQKGGLDRESLRGVSNGEVTSELTRIRGIGEWTARMYLIFALGREDLFPVGDLAVRRAMEQLYGLDTREEMTEYAERWRPYRSYATLYLWEWYES